MKVRQCRRSSVMPGRWPIARSNGVPALSPSRRLSAAGVPARAATDEDIERITEEYRRAARLAVEAGFDCLEIHLGHNYLLSAFLSPRLNRRTDRWGGTPEYRARFPRQVVTAVREAAGTSVAVTAKLNMADGVPGGFWLDESIPFARMLEADGALDALVLTGGSSLSNPMYLFRGEAPRREFAATLPGPLRLGFRLVGLEVPARLSLRGSLLPALRPAVPPGGVSAADPARGSQSTGHGRAGDGGGLLVRGHGPGSAPRARLGGALGEGGSQVGSCIHCNKCMPTIY